MINKTDLTRPRPKWAVIEEREQLALSSMQDIQPKATEWLWEDRIPLGEISSIDGDPASNKSSLVLDLAARVSTGSSMPDETPGVYGEVLLILGEDSIAKTVRKRLEQQMPDSITFWSRRSLGDLTVICAKSKRRFVVPL